MSLPVGWQLVARERECCCFITVLFARSYAAASLHTFLRLEVDSEPKRAQVFVLSTSAYSSVTQQLLV